MLSTSGRLHQAAFFVWEVSMNLIKANQNGRSIMEMLGVLAVVGILSVGGIAGFSTAMSKHKNMKEVEKYNLFVQDFMQHKSLILKSGDAMGTSQWVFYTKEVEKLGILPPGWQVKGSNIVDNLGHRFNLYSGLSRDGIVMGLYLNTKKGESTNTMFCIQIWQNFILPNQEWIGNVWLNGTGTKSGTYYGTNFCSKGRKCLAHITVPEIHKFCTSCAEETVCNIITTFR